ncbi:MAG TPA: hypothetical protein VNL18_11200 [Gemmatimonadales bacterium]|nr:hypothetical protein [Gemmatimonadales bacterium]
MIYCRTAVTDLYGRAGRAWLRTVELSPMGRLQVNLRLELAHVRPLTTAFSEARLQLTARTF